MGGYITEQTVVQDYTEPSVVVKGKSVEDPIIKTLEIYSTTPDPRLAYGEMQLFDESGIEMIRLEIVRFFEEMKINFCNSIDDELARSPHLKEEHQSGLKLQAEISAQFDKDFVLECSKSCAYLAGIVSSFIFQWQDPTVGMIFVCMLANSLSETLITIDEYYKIIDISKSDINEQ